MSGSPEVSILIPAYSPRFFEAALRSALAQTHGSFEVVVSDDCPDDGIVRLVEAVAAGDPRVRYVRNRPAKGPRDNYLALFDLARGRKIKYLNDDDVLLPDSVRRLAACLDDPSVTLATSHRRLVDAGDRPLVELPATRRIVIEDARLEGPSLAAWMLRNQLNVVGEPTTTMFRRDDLAGDDDLFSLAGRRILGLGDVTMWTRLLAAGDLVYLVESLSWFRLHDGQRQADPVSQRNGEIAWAQIREAAPLVGVHEEGAGVVATPLGERPWWEPDTSTAVAVSQAALAAGDVAAAVSALSSVATRDADDAEVLLLRGRALRAAGDLAGAVSCLVTSGAVMDGFTPAFVELSSLLLSAGHRDDAVAALEQAALLNPGTPELERLLSRLRPAPARAAAAAG